MQKLIKLSDTHYIIVDDSEIKEDWIVDTNDANFIFKITSGYIKDNGHYDWKKYKFKITHSTQPDKGMENVTFISLSEVEELVKDKLFTIEDLRRAFDAGNEGSGGSLRNRVRKYNGFDEYITNELGYVWNKDNGYVNPKENEWGVEFDKQGKIKLI